MKNNSEGQYVCMDLPEGGIEPVNMITVDFIAEGQIVVSNTTVIKCKILEGILLLYSIKCLKSIINCIHVFPKSFCMIVFIANGR